MTEQVAIGQGKVGNGDGRNGIREPTTWPWSEWDVWKGGPSESKAAIYKDQEPAKQAILG